MYLTPLLLCALLVPPGDRNDRLARTSRIVQPDVQRAFYRSGGRLLLGRKVHLHVKSSVLRRLPQPRETKWDGQLLVFENRTVPIVIYSRNPYWVQVRRHLKEGEVCLKGRLKVPDWAPRGRVHLLATRLKRVPGTRRGS